MDMDRGRQISWYHLYFFPALTRGASSGSGISQTPRADNGRTRHTLLPCHARGSGSCSGEVAAPAALSPLQQPGALRTAETPATSSLHHSGGIVEYGLGFYTISSRLCQWFFEEREGTPVSGTTKRSVTSSAPWGYTVGKRLISHFFLLSGGHFCLIALCLLQKLLCPLQNGLGQVAAPVRRASSSLRPWRSRSSTWVYVRPPRSSLWTE